VSLFSILLSCPNPCRKLALLNAGSIPGRLLPPFLADRLGIYNMLIPCLVTSSILLFVIFGVTNFAGIIVVSLGFGFSSGACKYVPFRNAYLSIWFVLRNVDVSLIPALLGNLSTHLGELGFVISSPRHLHTFD
jgi:MCP family monocarboxylic acid transporter-like MFS transporter 10